MNFKNISYKKNDPVYEHNNDFDQPKEYFKIIAGLIKKRFHSSKIKVIDVGCASGAFLFYVNKYLNLEYSVGIDISEKHLNKARSRLPKSRFYEMSVLELDFNNLKKFDVCTFLGTMAIFDNMEPILSNLFKLISKSGFIYIFDHVNHYPIDMIMRYKNALTDQNNDWNSGLNIRSKETYLELIKKINSKAKVNFYDFRMPFEIEKTENFMRAWTISTSENKNQIVVGTGQMLNFKIIEISY